MIIDLHNHTSLSYDGFTEAEDLLAACLMRGINAVAVTEHDQTCTVDSELFKRNGIELIPGCEYTTEGGAHIIGLFVMGSLPYGTPRGDIISYIKSNDGIVVMPHPWKPGSGYLAIHGDEELVNEFDFIELVNGGWHTSNFRDDIIDISRCRGLRMISSSDSHRPNQVGLCATRILGLNGFKVGDAKAALKNATQLDLEILIDKKMLIKNGRRPKKIQTLSSYQLILSLIPYCVRRKLKKLHYRYSSNLILAASNFEVINPTQLTW